MSDDDCYPCIGICMPDPDSGRCMGCGRPPLESPDAVVLHAERQGNAQKQGSGDPDSPPPPAATD